MKHTIDSTLSYCVAGCGVLVSHLYAVASVLEPLTLIVAFFLVVIRLIYDSLKLVRRIKEKDRKSND